MRIEGLAEGRFYFVFKMAEIQDGHRFKASPNLQSADFAGTGRRSGSGADANRRSSRGEFPLIFNRAEIQDGGRFSAVPIVRRPINRQPATGSARRSLRRKEDDFLFPTRPSPFGSARFRFPSIFTGFSPQKVIELAAQ